MSANTVAASAVLLVLCALAWLLRKASSSRVRRSGGDRNDDDDHDDCGKKWDSARSDGSSTVIPAWMNGPGAGVSVGNGSSSSAFLPSFASPFSMRRRGEGSGGAYTVAAGAGSDHNHAPWEEHPGYKDYGSSSGPASSSSGDSSSASSSASSSGGYELTTTRTEMTSRTAASSSSSQFPYDATGPMQAAYSQQFHPHPSLHYHPQPAAPPFYSLPAGDSYATQPAYTTARPPLSPFAAHAYAADGSGPMQMRVFVPRGSTLARQQRGGGAQQSYSGGNTAFSQQQPPPQQLQQWGQPPQQFAPNLTYRHQAIGEYTAILPAALQAQQFPSYVQSTGYAGAISGSAFHPVTATHSQQGHPYEQQQSFAGADYSTSSTSHFAEGYGSKAGASDDSSSSSNGEALLANLARLRYAVQVQKDAPMWGQQQLDGRPADRSSSAIDRAFGGGVISNDGRPTGPNGHFISGPGRPLQLPQLLPPSAIAQRQWSSPQGTQVSTSGSTVVSSVAVLPTATNSGSDISVFPVPSSAAGMVPGSSADRPVTPSRSPQSSSNRPATPSGAASLPLPGADRPVTPQQNPSPSGSGGATVSSSLAGSGSGGSGNRRRTPPHIPPLALPGSGGGHASASKAGSNGSPVALAPPPPSQLSYDLAGRRSPATLLRSSPLGATTAASSSSSSSALAPSSPSAARAASAFTDGSPGAPSAAGLTIGIRRSGGSNRAPSPLGAAAATTDDRSPIAGISLGPYSESSNGRTSAPPLFDRDRGGSVAAAAALDGAGGGRMSPLPSASDADGDDVDDDNLGAVGRRLSFSRYATEAYPFKAVTAPVPAPAAPLQVTGNGDVPMVDNAAASPDMNDSEDGAEPNEAQGDVSIERQRHRRDARVPVLSAVTSQQLEIAFDSIALGRLVGEGAFGKVYKAKWRGTAVAVKTLAVHQLSPEVVRDFRDEIAVLSSLRHPNILLFMGACTTAPNYAIVTELMSRGSVWDLLHDPQQSHQPPIPAAAGNNSNSKAISVSGSTNSTAMTAARNQWHIPPPPARLDFRLILKMALDVARGMAYLHR